MTIPPDATIAPEKLTQYLLRFLEKDDKSKYLMQAGFTLAAPDVLEVAIRQANLDQEAVLDRTTEFGAFYVVRGNLVGPNGLALKVMFIWLHRSDGAYSFVTLYPDKDPKE